MANKVTGVTDITGSLGVIAVSEKSIIIIGETSGDVLNVISPEVIFSIKSTVDAVRKFGSTSPVADMVRAMIINRANNIKGMIVGTYGDGMTYASKALAYAAALAKTMNDRSIVFIQFDTNSADLHSALKTHLDTAEAEDMFRYHVACMAAGATNSTMGLLSTALNHSRIFLIGPNPMDASNAATDGIYLAAGAAAVIANEINIDPALPLNGVKINGFDNGLERVLLNSDKTTLVAAGISPVYDYSGSITIFKLVTTFSTDSEGNASEVWHEATTRFIADHTLKAVTNRLLANYPRTKNVSRVLDSIRTDVVDVLQIQNDLEIIQNFDKSTVSVIKDPDDSYGALVDYEFEVVTPLYTITINQHMKL